MIIIQYDLHRTNCIWSNTCKIPLYIKGIDNYATGPRLIREILLESFKSYHYQSLKTFFGGNTNLSTFTSVKVFLSFSYFKPTVPPVMTVGACVSSPCQNGGTCVEHSSENGFHCNCTESFNGTRCELFLVESSREYHSLYLCLLRVKNYSTLERANWPIKSTGTL